MLGALGLPDERGYTALRFAIGRYNTEEHIDIAVEALAEAVGAARARSSAASA